VRRNKRRTYALNGARKTSVQQKIFSRRETFCRRRRPSKSLVATVFIFFHPLTVVAMELFKKIALVVGAFVIAGFVLKLVFGVLSMLFSIKGLLLIAAIAIPIYLIAEKKFLR
jgi:hypothetical protein